MGETFVDSTLPADPLADGSPQPGFTPPTDPNAQPAPRPEGLPEKFADMAAYNASYLALEQKLGAPAAPADPATPPAALTPPPAAGDPPPAQTTPNPTDGLAVPTVAPPLDFAPFEEEFGRTGALGDESYQKLEAMGVPRATVDQYIAGQVAAGNQQVTAIHASVGGQQQYQEIMAWASRNLTAEETTAFNSQVQGQEAGVAKMAIQGLQARFQAATGTQPQLLEGGKAPVGVVGFRSKAEMQEAIADPRYEKDPAYRNDVLKRVGGASF